MILDRAALSEHCVKVFLASAAGDLATFSKLKQHYKTDYSLTTDLFTRDTRPRPIRTLYEAARDTTQPEVSPHSIASMAFFNRVQLIYLRIKLHRVSIPANGLMDFFAKCG